jgi:hypothetical protein
MVVVVPIARQSNHESVKILLFPESEVFNPFRVLKNVNKDEKHLGVFSMGIVIVIPP